MAGYRDNVDRIDAGTARAVLSAYGFPTQTRRGRVYVGEQRVPLRRSALAALLGVPADGMLTTNDSVAMATAREMGEW